MKYAVLGHKKRRVFNNLELCEQAIRLYISGESTYSIAKQLNSSPTTIWRIVKRVNISRTLADANRLAFSRGKNSYPLSLRGEKSARWKGGGTTHCGYILIYKPEHRLANKGGYVLEHRLIMELQLGRYLLSTEHVHHINGIKHDNRPENLELLSPNDHRVRSVICSQCGLRKDIRLLSWQIKELKEALQLKLRE